MSLSTDILNANIENVKRRIRLGASINDYDPYGYTPLIIALMTEQEEIVDLLISKGADVNRPDLFGAPPLHWAVKLESAPLCQRLLKQGAFPNTFSGYGEPLLVYPLLKKNFNLIKILEDAGSHRSCAEDYIFIKYLGHHFELMGFGCFKNYNNIVHLVDYQGFRLEFSVHQLHRQFEAFVSTGHAKSWPYVQTVLPALERAVHLRAIKKTFPSEQEKACKNYLDSFNLIPMAFDGHAVSLAYSDNFVVLCDRALNRPQTTQVFQLSAPLDTQLVSYFLYGKKTHQYWQELPQRMGWTPIFSVPIPHQKVGNCSWANLETAPLLLSILVELEQTGSCSSENLLALFNEWVNWSRGFLLKQASIKVEQLSGDRKFALTLTLFQIMIQHAENSAILDQLSFLITPSFYRKEFDWISQQHLLNASPFQKQVELLRKKFLSR